MRIYAPWQCIGILALAALSAPLFAATLEGDYLQVGNSFFEKLSFRPGGKVRITALGQTKVGTYELDGKEVLVTIGNETNVFTIDDKGCVVGGGILGKYCKGSAAAGDKPAEDTPAPGGKDAKLSGRYKAGDAKMNISLDFRNERQVRITVAGNQAKTESHDVAYKVAGDRITISDPSGGAPLVLTRKGNVLEGAPAGDSVKLKFVKQ